MTTKRRRFAPLRVHRERDQTNLWVGAGYPWLFECRRVQCQRKAHHATWSRAMSHAARHSCIIGSLW